jgi:murein L,D-transpeptidase YafK/Tfp pilus assembly protein PilF
MKRIRNKIRITFFFFTLVSAVLIAVTLLVPPDLQSQPENNALSFYERGNDSKDKGNYDKALEYYQKAIKLNPEYEDAHFAIGVVYYKQDRLTSAINAFERVLQINPASRETHNNLAVIYELQGDYERAMKELQETIRLDPAYEKGHLNLAKLYFARSIQEYFQVIQSSDKNNGEVRKRLRHLLEADPDSADLQFYLGILNRIEGDPGQAEKNLRRAAKIDPAYRNRVALELGALFEETGQLNDAYNEYNTLLKKDRENFTAAYSAGRIKNKLKEYTVAEGHLRQARKIHETPEVDYELGLARQGLGRMGDAIASFKKSLAQEDNPEVRFSLAMAYKENKEYTEALKEFETILDTYPDQEVVQKEIVEITRLRLAEATPPPQKKASPSPVTKKLTGTIPSPLIGLEHDKGYALLVDKSTQTMLLYQSKNGEVTHIKTIACSTGKNNGKKSKEGDKKTPEGIYLFTSVKTDKELLPEYGKMAFPMDYPNFYDRKHGKNGNGIWLHSTNEPLRALLPQKTRGCVVVNNQDILELSKMIRLYNTPIIIYDKLSTAAAKDQEALRVKILSFLEAWKKSWEAKDLNRFMNFYSPSFTNGDRDYAAWKNYKKSVFSRARKISLDLTPSSILRHEDYFVVTFKQMYRAGRYSDNGIKRLFLIHENNRWYIVGEEWRKI